MQAVGRRGYPLSGIGEQFPPGIPLGEPDPALVGRPPLGRFPVDGPRAVSRQDEPVGEAVVVETCLELICIARRAMRYVEKVFIAPIL